MSGSFHQPIFTSCGPHSGSPTHQLSDNWVTAKWTTPMCQNRPGKIGSTWDLFKTISSQPIVWHIQDKSVRVFLKSFKQLPTDCRISGKLNYTTEASPGGCAPKETTTEHDKLCLLLRPTLWFSSTVARRNEDKWTCLKKSFTAIHSAIVFFFLKILYNFVEINSIAAEIIFLF